MAERGGAVLLDEEVRAPCEAVRDDRPREEGGQSTIVGGGRYIMPDGEPRYLVDHERLMDATRELGGSLVDPLKSTVVHGRRSMGTWVVRKGR